MKIRNQTLFSRNHKIADVFNLSESIVVYPDDCLELLKSIPDESIQLIVTSPPYNIGKEYEKKLHLDLYNTPQKPDKVIWCMLACHYEEKGANRNGRQGTQRTRCCFQGESGTVRVAELNDGMKSKKNEGVIYSICGGVTHSQALPAKLRERAAGGRWLWITPCSGEIETVKQQQDVSMV